MAVLSFQVAESWIAWRANRTQPHTRRPGSLAALPRRVRAAFFQTMQDMQEMQTSAT